MKCWVAAANIIAGFRVDRLPCRIFYLQHLITQRRVTLQYFNEYVLTAKQDYRLNGLFFGTA